MQDGITIEEACARNVIGTEEDFNRNCNPDGTVKAQTETTSLYLKNDSSSQVTINNYYLYIGLILTFTILLITLAIIFHKLKIKKRSK